MTRKSTSSGSSLFRDVPYSAGEKEPLAPGAVLLRGYVADQASALWEALGGVVSVAPFRHMVTPGGFRMSVAMTNCGDAGWVSDRSGYRYAPIDPITGLHWPAIPGPFRDVARGAAASAGFPDFEPDVCLVNRYEPGARLTLHQDKDECDFGQPIVSVSLGLPAVFLFGTGTRKDRPRRMRLESGDVAVWGGPSRLFYHGIAPLPDGDDPLTGRCRINLTFRKAL
jgi:alkylated DNA repair protein (DNA oxidative demethylase)